MLKPHRPDSVRAFGLRARLTVGNDGGSQEWYTPQHCIRAVKEVLGNIELDPASSPEANQYVKAHRYFTIEEDMTAPRMISLEPEISAWTRGCVKSHEI
jgi:hypothetical protein